MKTVTAFRLNKLVLGKNKKNKAYRFFCKMFMNLL